MGRGENRITTDNPSLADLVRWLREQREEAKLTYRRLAELTGLHATTLQRAASGRTVPKFPVVLAYAQACDARPDQARSLWKAARRWERRAARPKGAGPVPSPQMVRDVADLGVVLADLYDSAGAPALRTMEKQAGELGLLARSSAHRIVTRQGIPSSQAQMTAFLVACDVPSQDQERWIAAFNRVQRHRPRERDQQLRSDLRDQVLRRVALAMRTQGDADRDPAACADLTDPSRVVELLTRLRDLGQRRTMVTFAEHAAPRVGLADAQQVACLLMGLRKAGTRRAVAVLAARSTRVDLTDGKGIARLLLALDGAGERESAAVLADRAAARVAATDPHEVADLLRALRDVGAREQASVFADRAVPHVELTDTRGITRLLRTLAETGEAGAAEVLADRAAYADLTDADHVAGLLEALRVAGEHPAFAVLAARAVRVGPGDAEAGRVAGLLVALRQVGDRGPLALLAARAAAQADLTDAGRVADLLMALWRVGEHRLVRRLAHRAARRVGLTDAGGVARLLVTLPEMGERAAAEVLADRATHAYVTDAGRVTRLLRALYRGHKWELAARLAARAAASVDLSHESGVVELMTELWEMGELDAVAVLTERHGSTVPPGAVTRGGPPHSLPG